MFSRTDTTCCQIKMGMVAYLGADYHMFQNRHDMSTGQFGYGGVPGCCVDLVCGYHWQMLSSYFCVSQVSRQTCIETMEPRLFEEWIEKANQRDANLCGAYAHPTDEHSLMRGGEGYNQGSFVYFAKACGGWVFAGVNGVGRMDVVGSSVLSDGWG